MEERGKTIMCSVLFLDIVEYSKRSVSGQISLKERFNAYLSVAIRDVPLDDRIILDTGDGAALSFLGDVEDALQVALSLRESLRSEGALMEPPLLVRMGINLGPVRLVKDINGQPNIVGDGINVAQRIMGFSEPGQIQVSRSYYDAVSRLSPEYADMFHYQGSRTDKHVREHEIYAIGYPGEFAAEPQSAGDGTQPGKLNTLLERLSKSWQFAAQRLDTAVHAAVDAFRAASPKRRAVYVGALVVPLMMVTWLGVKLTHHEPAPALQVAEQPAAQEQAQQPTTVQAPSVQPAQPPAVMEKNPETSVKKPEVKEKAVPDKTKHKPAEAKPAKEKSKPAADKQKAAKEGEGKTGFFGTLNVEKGEPGFLSVSCLEGSSVFVDGFPKGTIAKTPLSIQLDPGKHQVTITHTSKSTVYTEKVIIKTGETVRMRPGFCD